MNERTPRKTPNRPATLKSMDGHAITPNFLKAMLSNAIALGDRQHLRAALSLRVGTLDDTGIWRAELPPEHSGAAQALVARFKKIADGTKFVLDLSA